MNAIKKFGTSFSSITLHAVNVALKENTLSHTLFKSTTESRPSTLLRVFFIGRSGCPTNRKNRGRGVEALPASHKVWTFRYCWISPSPKNCVPIPPLMTDHILEKKVSLIAFRQIFPRFLPVASIFSYTSWLIWKSSLEQNSLIQNSVQQD